ncbi:phage antirepressor KilAC domain-containing protein [Acetobacterium wieringae]|uniref:phage antirepressor KilAC domain-containing protein n=1 Tax=Acetobacterium wieringae TaxID=52694 RepID=UPI0020349725|nr:phage antirepressor KilAC domain-containing protein [Acetobacterium wieringae]URN85829.1 phage antirepressor KilAC domain-containing protein [Acetobacterium wieringae]
MNNLMIFEGRQVEVFEFKGQVLFNPYHVAECLDIKNVRDNIAKMNEKQVMKLTNLDVGKADIRKLNNAGENFLTESGVYKLIFKSHKPDAEKFQDWVVDEVLPTIRKHGAYMTPAKIEEVLLNPDTIINLATRLKEEQALVMKLEAKMFEDRPKVIFAESVTASEDSILVGEMAKLLKQNGFNTGQNRFYALLREQGFLIKRKGSDYNLPTQKSIEMGLFEIKETVITHSDGRIKVEKTAKITGKGQLYFMNRFKPSADIAAE